MEEREEEDQQQPTSSAHPVISPMRTRRGPIRPSREFQPRTRRFLSRLRQLAEQRGSVHDVLVPSPGHLYCRCYRIHTAPDYLKGVQNGIYSVNITRRCLFHLIYGDLQSMLRHILEKVLITYR